ncbi:MAG: cytochrome c biogenesis protein CcsA [Spirochaetes bacterium]|nr:cytochrome c biogenesis protein CcsA [Spirochaetota bacterium]
MIRGLSALLLLAVVAFASEVPAGKVSLSSFRAIAILDEGRIKPLDTFARGKLLQFSARETFAGKPAIQWLARVFFDPESAADDKIFRVENPQVTEALGVPAEASLRYSLKQLEPSFPALQELYRRIAPLPDKERDPVQKGVARLYVNVNQYLELQTAFLFAAPSPTLVISEPSVRARLGLPSHQTACSWLELRDLAPNLMTELERSDVSTEVMLAAQGMRQMAGNGAALSLPVLPVKTKEGLRWESPWPLLSAGISETNLLFSIHRLSRLRAAWISSDDAAFQREADGLRQEASSVCKSAGVTPPLKLEVAYNLISPFANARILYIAAFLLLMVSWLFIGPRARRLVTVAWGVILLALLLHACGIAARMAITGRPPVTNLYETFLFVAAVIVAVSLLVERTLGNRLGLLVGAISGTGFLFLAGRFATEGDTLRVLVAVLDSNFWLSTHVLAVTIGYAGVVLSGILGHVWMVQAIRGRAAAAAQTAKLVYGTQAFGLLFTFTGTILGGVWADQSWGRFWGWDPKENGALLIVIWSAMIFHARLVGWVRETGFAAASMAGILVVCFAWFGVNFLGVGLHAYGFSDGARAALYAYGSLQTLLILFGAWFAHARLAQSRGPE